MKIKLLAILVLVMIVSLSVPGCINVNMPTASPSRATSTHNPALEKLVSEFKLAQNTRIVSGALPTFSVTWHNDNSVTLETFFSDNPSFPENSTWTAFPTTQGATNYLNSIDKSDYRLINNTDSKSDAFASQYYNATGHYAQTFQHWFYLGSLQPPYSESRDITQWDNILEFTTTYFGVSKS
jgi:hypothetical protein